MARINQGVFREIKKKYNALESKLNKFKNDYYPEGDLTLDDWYDFFGGYVYEADEIYTMAGVLSGLINGMLSSTKFENDDKRNTYVDILSKTRDIKYEIKEMFDNAVDLVSSDGLEGIEQRTLDQLSIYRK